MNLHTLGVSENEREQKAELSVIIERKLLRRWQYIADKAEILCHRDHVIG